MRWVICAVVVLAFAPRAFADDLDILRGTDTVGPATFTKWSGFYFGAQTGFTGGNANFANSTQAPIAYALRDTALEDTFEPSNWPICSGYDVEGNLRRLCRLQHTMGRFRPRRRVRLFDREYFLHRAIYADQPSGEHRRLQHDDRHRL